jgi:ribosomal protein S18 acetylase RimI-like enzyme
MMAELLQAKTGYHDLSPRKAILSDLASIQGVIAEAYKKYLVRMEIPPAPMLRNYLTDIEAGITWVIGEPAVGVIVLIPKRDYLFIDNIAVHPSTQGMGLGRRLMDYAEQEATRHSLSRLALYTHEVMTENQEIYHHLGYLDVEHRLEDGYRRIYMEKTLDPPSSDSSLSRPR